MRRIPSEEVASENRAYIYDAGFFDYISDGSRSSAEAVVAVLKPLLRPPASVLDVGCGLGVWAARFAKEPSVSEVVGVDGAYIDRDMLVIPSENFLSHDLTKEFRLGRRFTLALSLEVGEHLPSEATSVLVETLVSHADIVAFSAAVPGQGGEHHVNERPLDDWRNEFATHGYAAFDYVRPLLAGRGDVEPWYRYNIMLYVKEEVVSSLPETVRATRLDDGAPVPEVSPLLWRLRCAALRTLPRPAVDRLAMTKHALVRAARTRRVAR
ncbi:MAG: class I SAM-dependent methyltransferase [Pseudomonadota bacterium]